MSVLRPARAGRWLSLKTLALTIISLTMARHATAQDVVERASRPSGPADLVVLHAEVWTGESSQREASAFAVREGRFIAVGSEADVRPLIGDATQVLDAKGRRILPGLIDTHVHLESAASGFAQLNLRPATSQTHLLQLVREWALAHPDDEWVIGRGWSAESWPDPTVPTPEEIDAAAGGRPAMLIRMDGHSLIAGAETIKRAGVTATGPPDPSGGKIGRRADGAPNGAFYDQAMGLVASKAPDISAPRMRLLLKEALAYAASQGLTQVGAIDTRAFTESQLVPLDREGEISLRIGVTLTGGGDTIEAWKPILEWASAHRNPSAHVSVLGFKGYMDGSLGSRTAWMLEPYFDDPSNPDNVGFPLAMAENGTLPALIKLAHDMNLQPAVHAIGDRANRQLLNWYQFMGPERWQRRPRVEHAQHLSPADIPLFVRMSVIPSMQPLHKADDGRYAEERIGPERIKSSYAFRDLYDSGATLVFGSDWPVVDCNPFLGIAAAVTAKTIAGETFVPEQSLTVEEALMCYTRNASWALFSETRTGMIQPNALADFIVIDRDILTINPDQIAATSVLQTFVEGRLVYDRAAQPQEAPK